MHIICLRCNAKDKVRALITTIGPKQKVTGHFIKQNINTCIHSSVTEAVYTKEKVIAVEQDYVCCKILINSQKHHMAICFDGKTHGLVCVLTWQRMEIRENASCVLA